jgi:predicted RNase H-like HicB family nuclease
MNEIKYIVIQSGYYVFGAGNTRDEALEDAAEWMEGINNADEVESLIKPGNTVDGDICVIDESDDEFDDYLEEQGGFVKIDGKWYEEK